MCGRTCLTLEPDSIRCACKYKFNNHKQSTSSEFKKENESINEEEKDMKENIIQECVFEIPEWRPEYNCGRKYNPSYNIAPTDVTPVLISAEHFADGKEGSKIESSNKRILVPMMWGMIPFWHKGDYRKHGLSTNNCRLEHMLESKLYRGPFRRGFRCVVLCEAFYEWQTTKSSKPSERAAYSIYMPQLESIKIYDKNTWSSDNVNLLKMAGLFDIWEDENGDKIFSYSVITFESSKLLKWLHHRMPAILETEEQVDKWLDFKHYSDEEALSVLKPASELKWHRVSNIVNNSRNKSEECNKPIEMVKSASSGSGGNKSILSWLRKRGEDVKKAELSDEDDQCENVVNNSEGNNKEEIVTSPVRKRPRFRDDLKS